MRPLLYWANRRAQRVSSNGDGGRDKDHVHDGIDQGWKMQIYKERANDTNAKYAAMSRYHADDLSDGR